MQKWEYFTATVWFMAGYRVPYEWEGGEGDAVKEVLLDDFLRQMGEEGWELVTVMRSQDKGGNRPEDAGEYVPEHLLYFKRPKP